jgi:hypothetical protein
MGGCCRVAACPAGIWHCSAAALPDEGCTLLLLLLLGLLTLHTPSELHYVHTLTPWLCSPLLPSAPHMMTRWLRTDRRRRTTTGCWVSRMVQQRLRLKSAAAPSCTTMIHLGEAFPALPPLSLSSHLFCLVTSRAVTGHRGLLCCKNGLCSQHNAHCKGAEDCEAAMDFFVMFGMYDTH